MRLVLATQNSGKVREMAESLSSLGLEVVGLAEMAFSQADETGATFEENARLKALSAAKGSGLWALAEDSGLEVDALDGAPGVYSARFAGDDATDEENNEKLLQALANVPREERGAQFRCVMVLVSPHGRTWTAEGTCVGYITHEPRGVNGFGYDPLFVPEAEERTFAQMGLDEKKRISHRARALTKMLRILAKETKRG